MWHVKLLVVWVRPLTCDVSLAPLPAVVALFVLSTAALMTAFPMVTWFSKLSLIKGDFRHTVLGFSGTSRISVPGGMCQTATVVGTAALLTPFPKVTSWFGKLSLLESDFQHAVLGLSGTSRIWAPSVSDCNSVFFYMIWVRPLPCDVSVALLPAGVALFVLCAAALVTVLPKVSSWFDKLSLQPAFRDAINTLFRKDVKEALKVRYGAQLARFHEFLFIYYLFPKIAKKTFQTIRESMYVRLYFWQILELKENNFTFWFWCLANWESC